MASDFPGNRDLVVHDQTGFLLPVGDRAGFAQGTIRLLDDADLAARCRQAAVQRVRDEFSVEQMIQRHVALYRDMLAE